MSLKRNADRWAEFVEQVVIQRRPLAPGDIVALEVLKLYPPPRPADLIDAVVVAQVHYIVAPGMPLIPVPGETGHAVRTENAKFTGQLIIIRDQHAAFAGGHVLVRKEAEAADGAPGSQHAALQL